ncbi:MAG: UDP-glucuronic acid decarboxylase family protein [Oligoflexia bacterium]|nr:UDP-glucuronic acid decarboxylase family protein [Oligoflexia bacterium]
MKVALVAGGAGFIGSHLCELLLAKNYRVYAIDNLVTGRRSNIEHLINNKSFSWIEHDINNPLHMNVACDEIYNLASPASPIDFEKIPDFILRTGSIGHLNLLQWAQQQNARILIASTSEVYGDPLEHPQKETYLGNVDCTGIRGCYDEAKRFAEAMTMAYHRRYKIDTKIMRIFNTYGPRMRPEDGRVIPNFFMQALKKQPFTIYGDGKQTRSLCYVTDLVEGMHMLMQSSINTPTNIGNPDEYTILDIAKNVGLACKVDFKTEHKPLPPSDPKQRRPDITKAKRELKWEPKVSLREGFEKTLEYFKSTLV